jgi:hypothetical protein
MPIIFVFTNAKEDDRYQDRLYSKGCKHLSSPQRLQMVMEKGIPFKLIDEDDELHFEGKYLDLNDPRNIDFEPLDIQMHNTGCTTMMYLEDGEWKQL